MTHPIEETLKTKTDCLLAKWEALNTAAFMINSVKLAQSAEWAEKLEITRVDFMMTLEEYFANEQHFKTPEEGARTITDENVLIRLRETFKGVK